MNSSHQYNVIIVGGGPAGCATALALRLHGVDKILVVESTHYETYRIGESIPPDTRILMEKLQIWQDFLNEEQEVCMGSCSSWGSDDLGFNDFLCNPQGMGRHLDRNRFDSFLANKAIENGVDLRTDMKFACIEDTTPDGYTLKFTGKKEESFKTRFIVDASGLHARVSSALGIKKKVLDRLVFVIAFFRLAHGSSALSQLTMLEAVEYGWWYAAKLPNQRLTIALATEPEIVKKGSLLQHDNWLNHLFQTEYIADQWSRYIDSGESLLLCHATSFLTEKVGGNNWLAVGNAASTYDPISSQGVYKAMQDGIEAAKAINDYFDGQENWPVDYQNSMNARFQDYLSNRNYFYGLEKRWPSSLFWKRRQTRTKPDLVSSRINHDVARNQYGKNAAYTLANY